MLREIIFVNNKKEVEKAILLFAKKYNLSENLKKRKLKTFLNDKNISYIVYDDNYLMYGITPKEYYYEDKKGWVTQKKINSEVEIKLEDNPYD